jgi:hypothetical protein
MSAELFISLHAQLSYLFMVSSALDLWVRDADQIEGRKWRVEGGNEEESFPIAQMIVSCYLFLTTYRSYPLPTTLYPLFRELEVSGEEEKGEGDTNGDYAGEDEVEPDVANADALAFDRHKH